MKKFSVFVVLILVSALATSIYAARQEKHVKARLEEIGGSGVSGFVQVTQLPSHHDGSNLHVQITGLEDGTEYASFYYESDDCSAPADFFEGFTANGSRATLVGKIDEDLDEVGSVSVRLGPGYGTLLACATIH